MQAEDPAPSGIDPPASGPSQDREPGLVTAGGAEMDAANTDSARAGASLVTSSTVNPPATQVPPPHPTLSAPGISSPAPPLSARDRDSAHPSTAGALSPTEAPVHSPKMIFSELYKSTKGPLARFRHHPQPCSLPADYDADLVSRDRAKVKEAVKRHLAAKVKNDWEFQWPPQSTSDESAPHDGTAEPTVPLAEVLAQQASQDVAFAEVDADTIEVEPVESDEDDAASVYSTVSEDAAHFRPRAEWTSDFSSDDEGLASPSAYRFDSPDTVGRAIQESTLTRQARVRRAIRAEAEWNTGLACFNARRDAWTGAKTVRVRPKIQSPTSPTTGRRRSIWRISSGSQSPISLERKLSNTMSVSPTTTRVSDEHATSSGSDAASKEVSTANHDLNLPVEVLIPIPPPLIPAANPMRLSITPAGYPAIYDKVVVNSLQPACPINLSDMIRACVNGWKRDGEWPPRPTVVTSVVAVRKTKAKAAAAQGQNPNRRKSFSFLGRRDSAGGDHSNPTVAGEHGKDDESSGTGKGLKKSIQRVLGFGHERSASIGSNNGAVVP